MKISHRTNFTKSWRIFGLAVVLPLLLTGCNLRGGIRPSLNVTSSPTGAYVTVNGESYGRTPVNVPFIWYWFYDVELKREGYETRKVRERMKAPPYFYIPFDFFFELMPWETHDKRYRHYYLDPVVDY